MMPSSNLATSNKLHHFLFWFFGVGGIHNFYIEAKLCQLVVEKEKGGGGSFFELCIFERGKNFLRSVFMGKKVNLVVV